MNGSSNVLVLGVTGQVGKRVATNLKINSERRALSISMIHELSMRH